MGSIFGTYASVRRAVESLIGDGRLATLDGTGKLPADQLPDGLATETEADARYLQTATAQPINAQTGTSTRPTGSPSAPSSPTCKPRRPAPKRSSTRPTRRSRATRRPTSLTWHGPPSASLTPPSTWHASSPPDLLIANETVSPEQRDGHGQRGHQHQQPHDHIVPGRVRRMIQRNVPVLLELRAFGGFGAPPPATPRALPHVDALTAGHDGSVSRETGRPYACGSRWSSRIVRHARIRAACGWVGFPRIVVSHGSKRSAPQSGHLTVR